MKDSAKHLVQSLKIDFRCSQAVYKQLCIKNTLCRTEQQYTAIQVSNTFILNDCGVGSY